ncbi:hypothetical protein J8273_8107 [Carpediemonas membranifera]|uniref:Uncharacterized protein n=1 Tax=Carpediemonas membranifera TaxID=201153 RepID=A0A8J6E6Y5_9EUKA|nr:hypothetical protein J8273_8107 [Carpediemonas membranifera]|eukprot:KAG9390070.1 hypothetical protein J8273_8107 [Carpediemonas membranifera]
MGRLLSLSTDGVCVAVTVKRGGHYRPQHDASMPVRKRAKGREKERPRLGTNNADALPAPDPDAHLMGFDPGARSIGGYYIRHPDGTTSSGVLPKCGYTKTPSFGFDMTAASFKSTRLVSINNSIRFVLDNANDIFEAGMRKSFRRVRFANHILRQKHFALCGQQLAREFGWRRHLPIATPIRLKVFYGSSGFTTPAGMFIPCAPYRKFAREIVPLLKRYTIVDLNMVNEDRTTVVCPHCHAPYKRVRPRDDQHVHPHRVMLCENPQCRGAQWRATVPDALNVDHRDKSAAETSCGVLLPRKMSSVALRSVAHRSRAFQHHSSIINWLTANIRLRTDDVVQFGTSIVPFRPCLEVRTMCLYCATQKFARRHGYSGEKRAICFPIQACTITRENRTHEFALQGGPEASKRG